MSNKPIVVAQIHPFTITDRIIKEYDEGTILSAIIKELEVSGSPRVAVNGEPITDFNYALKVGDNVTIKSIPEGEGATRGGAIATVVGFVVGVIGAVTGIVPLAVAGFAVGLAGTGVMAVAGTIESFHGLNIKFKQRYDISGGSNGDNKWGKVPAVVGEHRITPPYAVRPYTTISGTNGDVVTLHMIYAIGVGKIKVKDLRFGETVFAKNTAEVRNGSLTMESGFSGVSAEVYDNGTNPTLYPSTVIEEQVGVELKYGQETVRATAKNVDKIEAQIEFPSGLYGVSGNNTCNRSVIVEARYRVKGSGTAWSSMTPMSYFTGASTTIQKNLQQVLRYTAYANVTKDIDTAYEIIVKRLTADMTKDDMGTDIVRWDISRSYRTADKPISDTTRAKMTLVAMTIQANESLSGTVDSFSAMAYPDYQVWNGTGSGSAHWVNGFSRNPAVAYLAALRSPISPRPVADANIDWPRIEEWYTYCATEGYTCDGILSDGERLFDTLTKIATTGRAQPIMRDGKISVVIDKQRTVIVQHFTPHNSRNFTWSKKFVDYPDAYRISFISKIDDYKQVDRIVCDDGFTEDTATKFEKGALWGVTDPTLVWKHGRFQIACNHARTELYSFETSAESVICEPGDLIVCTHDVPMWGLNSGKIITVNYNESGNAISIVLDNDITQETGKSYSVRYRRASDNTSVMTALATVVGESRTLIFATPIAPATAPAIDDLVLFGETGSESVRLIVGGIEVGEDFTATLTCFDEAPGIYTDLSSVPDWDAHISTPPSAETKGIFYNATHPLEATPQPPGALATKSLVSLFDTVDFDGQFGIYGGVRYVGTMPNTWTLDDKTPIIMTSATTPSGTYVGQIGRWQSQFYVWNGTTWVFDEAVLPTDTPALYYSFDEEPDIPDDPAGISYRNVPGWTSGIDGWIGNTGVTLSIESGALKVVQSGSGDNGASWYRPISNYVGKNAVLKIKSLNKITNVGYYNGTTTISYSSAIKQDDYNWIVYFNNIQTTSSYLIFYINGSSVSETAWVSEIYIGTGAYLTPVIDNSGNGKHGSLSNSPYPVTGVSGKGIKGDVTTGYKLPVNSDFTLAFDWDVSQITADKLAIGGVGLGIKIPHLTTQKALFYFNGSCYRYSNVLTTGVHHFVFRYKYNSTPANQILDIFIDGINANSSAALTDPQGTLSNLFLYPDKMIDEFIAYTRFLSDAEIRGLYLAKSLPKRFTITDYLVRQNTISAGNTIIASLPSYMSNAANIAGEFIPVRYYLAQTSSFSRKSYRIPSPGTIRVFIRFASHDGVKVHVRPYIASRDSSGAGWNFSATGTDHSTTSTTPSVVYDDISVLAGQEIEIYAYRETQNSGNGCYVYDFYLGIAGAPGLLPNFII